MELFRRIDRMITVWERSAMLIAAVVLFTIMVVSTLDVGMRYLLNMPLSWSYDLISLFLMGTVFFFSLSDTLRNNEHVSVDLLHASMNDRTRHASLFVGYALAAIVFCGMVAVACSRLTESYANDEVVAGAIAWPTWIAALVVTVGLAITLLRIIYRAFGHLLSALSGRSFIPLPPISGAIEAV